MKDPVKLRDLSLDDLSLELGYRVGSSQYRYTMAELQRQELAARMEALEAEKRAAEAAAETAGHTRRSATYILWSVIAIAAASIINVLVVLFGR